MTTLHPDPAAGRRDRESQGERALASGLAFAIAFIAMVHTVTQWLVHAGLVRPESHLARLFQLDLEGNLATAFGGLLLLAAGGVLALIAVARRRAADRVAPFWFGLAAMFGGLAIDEMASFHELLIRPTRTLLPDVTTGLLHWAWVIPAGFLVALVTVLYLRFVFVYLPPSTRRGVVLGAALFVAGAIGVEMPEAAWVERHGMSNFTYSMFVLVEETLEMAGIAIFLVAMVRHLRLHGGRAAIEFASPADHPPRRGLAVTPGGVALPLAGVVGALLAAHVAFQWVAHVQGHPSVFGLVDRFDVGRAATLPTTFLGLQWILAGALAAAGALASRDARDGFAGRWRALAVAFASIGLLELAGFGTAAPGVGMGEFPVVQGAGSGWVGRILAAAVALALVIVAAPLLLRDLPRRVVAVTALGASLLVVGRVALAPIPLDPALDPDPQALRAGLWDAVVAGLQMGGCVFLCAGIVGTLRARYGVPIVVIDPVPVPRTTTVPARVPVEISA